MKRRHLTHDKAWHDAQMAKGPTGPVCEHWNVRTWDGLHNLAQDMVDAWEALPPADRAAYAYPNPEDKPR